jgi:hypothetical protein
MESIRDLVLRHKQSFFAQPTALLRSLSIGAPVAYDPGSGRWFAGCVVGPVRMLGSSAVVEIDGLPPEYAQHVGLRGKTRVVAAFVDSLVPLPSEYVEGEWCYPTDESNPAAVVTYSQHPSPETGSEGWVWWALGKVGDADSYDSAMAAAEAVIARHL